MKPRTRPNLSCRTLAIGTTQLVVQDAAEMTSCRSGSYSASLTPTTTVRSAPLPGAEMSTLRAPPVRCAGASSRARNFSGGLDDDAGAQLAPVDRRWVALGQDRDRRAVHDEQVRAVGHRTPEPTVGGVELQQVRQGPGVGHIVDGHDLEVVPFQGAPQECAADPAEAVDSHPCGHRSLLLTADLSGSRPAGQHPAPDSQPRRWPYRAQAALGLFRRAIGPYWRGALERIVAAGTTCCGGVRSGESLGYDTAARSVARARAVRAGAPAPSRLPGSAAAVQRGLPGGREHPGLAGARGSGPVRAGTATACRWQPARR